MPREGTIILIVDDEPEIRESLVFFLEHRGLRTLEADGGIRAWEILRKHRVDIILSDIRMPGEKNDGLHLLAQVQTLTDPPPVILMTGYADIDARQALRLGARAFVEKPFRMHELLVTLREIQNKK